MIYSTLGAAVAEVNRILESCPLVNAIIFKTDDPEPYFPTYVMPNLYAGGEDPVLKTLKMYSHTPYELVAVFATIR